MIIAATLIVVATIEIRIMNFEKAPPGAAISLPAIFNESFNFVCL